MNIFAVSRHPARCARALDDGRLNKMILETAQVLCTVFNLQADPTGRSAITPYRNSHVHNPITKWAASSKKHQAWLYALGIAYGEEIIYRFGRKHACHLVLEGLTFRYPHLLNYRELEIDEFHNGARHRKLGLDFTHLSPGKAYRAYLRERWRLQEITPTKSGRIIPPRWTRRSQPTWR